MVSVKKNEYIENIWWWSNLFTRESFPMDVFTKGHTSPTVAFLRLGSMSEWNLLENNLNDLFLNPLKNNTSLLAFWINSCHLCCSLHGRYNRGAVSYVSPWNWANDFLPPNEREAVLLLCHGKSLDGGIQWYIDSHLAFTFDAFQRMLSILYLYCSPLVW